MGKSFSGLRVLRMEPILNMALRLQREAAGMVLEEKTFGRNAALPPRVTDSKVDVEILVYCSFAN